MAEKLESGSDVVKTKQSSRVLVAVGLPTVLFTAIFMGRMVWEETFLTFQQGPQMLGYSLAHGAGAILLLAPWLLSLWLLVALVLLIVCLWHRRSLSKWYWSTFASAVRPRIQISSSRNLVIAVSASPHALMPIPNICPSIGSIALVARQYRTRSRDKLRRLRRNMESVRFRWRNENRAR